MHKTIPALIVVFIFLFAVGLNAQSGDAEEKKEEVKTGFNMGALPVVS